MSTQFAFLISKKVGISTMLHSSSSFLSSAVWQYCQYHYVRQLVEKVNKINMNKNAGGRINSRLNPKAM